MTDLDLKYADRMRKIQENIQALKTCEDIDDAVKLFESTKEHIDICKHKLSNAREKIDLIANDGTMK